MRVDQRIDRFEVMLKWAALVAIFLVGFLLGRIR